jgi:hypothetical protein
MAKWNKIVRLQFSTYINLRHIWLNKPYIRYITHASKEIVHMIFLTVIIFLVIYLNSALQLRFIRQSLMYKRTYVQIYMLEVVIAQWIPCGGGAEYLHISPASRRGEEKRSLESEKVKYGRESHGTRTREWYTDPILSPRSILILSTHLRLGLPSCLFLSGFPTNILYAILFSHIRVTCPAHLILLDLIILISLV